MINILAHFGLTILIILVDVLFITFITWISEADSDEFFVIGCIFNILGFALALSFLILGF